MRIVALADSHCGHVLGLTPPAWWWSRKRNPAVAKIQRAIWDEFTQLVEAVKPPVDVLFALGDLIEGQQEKIRGVELLAPDRDEQTEMAVEAIKVFEPREIIMVRGSPYHVGMEEEWEDMVAKAVGAEIFDEVAVQYGGVVFDLAHYVGRSIVPYGRATPVAREWVMNRLLATYGQESKADVILRGHVHYAVFVGGADWLAMTVPALGVCGGKIRRQRRGWVEFGLVIFDVEGGEYQWRLIARPVVEGKPFVKKS